MKPEFPKWEVDLLFVVFPLIIWLILCIFLEEAVASTIFFIVFGAISVRAVLNRLNEIIRLLSAKDEKADDTTDSQ